jgi:hypothetical protein
MDVQYISHMGVYLVGVQDARTSARYAGFLISEENFVFVQKSLYPAVSFERNVVCAMDPLAEIPNEFECWQNVQDTFFCSLRASSP